MIKIRLEGLYTRGAYYKVENNGEIKYVYGLDNIKKLIEETKNKKEKIELEENKGFEEHSELIKLLQD